MGDKTKFDGKVTFLGYGAVGQCTLGLLDRHLDVSMGQVSVIDFEDKRGPLEERIRQGAKFHQEKVTPENLDSVLSNHVGNDGLLIDLAWNIGANDILGWCHDHNTLYINTSVELWDPYSQKGILEKTLYWRHMRLREMVKDWPKNSVTAVVEHGANPGLISHFTKQGLLDIAERLIEENIVDGREREEITHYMQTEDFAKLAQTLGVKVIHCSERDTQITNRPKEVNQFVNTWSIAGFHEEGSTTSEMGWGTHERTLPRNSHVPEYGPKNQIFLARMGINTWARSWVPEVGEIEGMVIRHGEAFGISDRLTVRDKDGKPIYRPTVHYVYMPCHEALASLAELRARNYQLQERQRIMTDEIVSGKDILGALLMGHHYKSWWTGSSLSIEEARRVIPGQNATTLQVAAGVLSAVEWMLENPKKGFLIPDDLPHRYILNKARPYLGDFISTPSDWTPEKSRETIFFPENPDNNPEGTPWEYERFRPQR